MCTNHLARRYRALRDTGQTLKRFTPAECQLADGPCTTDAQCCTKELVCKADSCQPQCQVSGDTCAADSDCCEGTECNGSTCFIRAPQTPCAHMYVRFCSM